MTVRQLLRGRWIPSFRPGERGRDTLTAVLLGLTALAVGFTFSAYKPALVVVALLGLLYVVAVLTWPKPALLLVVFAQVALPTYVRVPVVPGLPEFPISLILLLLLAAVVTASALLDTRRRAIPAFDAKFTILMLLLGAVLLITQMQGDPGAGIFFMWIKVFAVPFGLFLACLIVLRTPRDIDRLFLVVLLSALAASLYGLVEWGMGRNPLAQAMISESAQEADVLMWQAVHAQEEYRRAEQAYRSLSVFLQPLEFAAFVAMIYPYALVRFATADSLRLRAAFAAAVGLCLLGVLASFSRGPVLTLVLVTLALAVPVKPLRAWVAGGAAATVTALVAAWPWVGGLVAARLADIENVTLRVKLWQAGTHIFLDHPLLGVGFGNYAAYHADIDRRYRVGPFYEYSWQAFERINTIENVFVQLAAETGIAGLTALGLVLAAFFAAVRRLLRRYPEGLERNLALAAAAGVAVFLLTGITVTNYYLYTITVFCFGVFLPAVVVLCRAPAGCERGRR